MTTPRGQEPERASAMKRYGPLIGVVGVIAVIAVVVTLAGKRDPGAENNATGNNTVAAATGANPDVPIIYPEAKAQGIESSKTWVDNCDPATGRIKMPTLFAPPCVPKLTGDNFGATSKGVTADKITIVNYVPSPNGDLTALLAGKLDTAEEAAETGKKYQALFDDLFETYGRKVEIVNYESNGAADDPVVAEADAVAVDEQHHAFASLGGPALTGAYADALKERGILCIGCGISSPDALYQQNAPYMWGPQPTAEEFLVNLGDFITNRVVGKPADFAGGDLKGKPRKFGVVHFEQNPPVFKELGDQVATCGSARGWDSAQTETYEFVIGKMPERATTIIAKMKEQGITTIVFLGDPLMPIYLTKQATAQSYFPEWIVTGTVLTDTTALGRLYDPEQWQHAYGISNLAVRMPREQSEPWKMHEWYYGAPPAAKNTNALIYAGLAQLYLGIHMAGPKLSPTTFRDGMFKYPESGGGPTTPHVSYGDHGYFKLPEGDQCTSDKPRLDYLGTDDVVEIWWDATWEGPDEQGKTEGKGAYTYASNGKRYLPGQMPKGDLFAFKKENSVVLLDKPPPEDTPPSYPSPATK